LETFLDELKSLVKYYNKLTNPKNESDRDIRIQLTYINRLEVNVAYPFLMQVYEDYSKGLIDKETFISILTLVQSYTWRRFVLGLPANSLNKIFMSLYKDVKIDDYLFSIQESLMRRPGAQRFPRNKDIMKALKEKDLYNIKSKNRTYLFERLENFENKEPVIIDGNSDITVEHIFPQNPDQKWKSDLSADDYNFIKENYTNTIGNLTLSGNNGKLGNKTFVEKRDLDNAGYKDSRLWLNKHLSTLEKWGVAEIESRFELIIDRFLKVWEIPNIEENENNSVEVNIFDAEDPTYKKLEYAIFRNHKYEITQVAKLYIIVFKQLFELQPETFFTSEIGAKIGLSKNPVEDNLRQPVQLNDTYFLEAGLGSMGKFDRIKLALNIFGLEDELIIKYAD
jgi:hypothetical protein